MNHQLWSITFGILSVGPARLHVSNMDLVLGLFQSRKKVYSQTDCCQSQNYDRTEGIID